MSHPPPERLEGISLDDEIRVLQKAIDQLTAKKAARDSAPVVPPQIVYNGTISIATAVSATVQLLRDLDPHMTADQRDRFDQIEQRCEQSSGEGANNVQ